MMSEEFVGSVPKEKEGMGEMLKGVALVAFWLVVAALFIGGCYYLARVLLGADTAILNATNSTTGIGLLIAALMLVVAQAKSSTIKVAKTVNRRSP